MLHPELLDQTQFCADSHARVCLIIKIIFTNCFRTHHRLNVDHLIYFDSVVKVCVCCMHRVGTGLRCQRGLSYLGHRDHIWCAFDIQFYSKDLSAFRLFLVGTFLYFGDRQAKRRDLDLMLARKR